MTVIPDDIALLRQSFEALRPRLDEASPAFYRRLFTHAPHLMPMFRTDIENQGMRFMTAISVILDKLGREGHAAAEIERLGHGHALLGVEPNHYAPMRTALIETFAEILGPSFTTRHADAWGRAYDRIAAGMIAAGAR